MWTVIVRDPTGKLHSKTPLKVGVLRIGRGKECDIVLKSGAVSRLHGRLLVGEGTLVYSDEKSGNGSTVDGQAVTQPVDVNEHSSIGLGGFQISLEREGADIADKTMQFSAEQLRNLAQAKSSPLAAAPAPPPAAVAAPAPAQPVAPSPQATAPRPATVLKSALEGAQFVIPDVPAATRQIEQIQHDKLSDSMAHLLDQQIRGIQSRRSEVEHSIRSAKEQFEQGWREAIVAARELHGRIKSNSKVMYYVVSRDEQEVNVKIADGSRRGYSNLILSRMHPETGKLQEGYVWFWVLGEAEPRSYREPKDALEDFVRRIAGKLA